MLKEFLSQKGISYIERDVTRDPQAAQELTARTGRMAVPVTIIDGETIVGFDRARLEQALSQMPPGLGAAVADARIKTGGTSGAYIGRVRSGSAAERLGLVPGDVITGVNGQPVSTVSELERALSGLRRGSRVSVLFLRNGRQLSAETAL